MVILRTALEKLVLVKDLFLKQSLKVRLIILAVVIAVGWFGVRPLIAGNRQQQVQYQTAQAEKGTLITSITASGTIYSGSSEDITSSATGLVQEVYVKNGDTVTEGDKIALLKLDKSSQQQQAQSWASYLSAKNSLESAKAKIHSLQAAAFKANQTFINDAVARSLATSDPTYIQENALWLQAEADYKNQENSIRQAQSSLSSAWLLYSQLSPTITAPMSGVVNNLSIGKGVTISGNNSTSSTADSNNASTQVVGTITLKDGTPQASVSLTEIDVVKIKPGQKVTLTLDAHPDKTFTGKVAAVNTNGSVSSGVTTYPATITFDTAADAIYPNMAVNATIITDVKSNVILVPSAAIQTTNGQSTVRIMSSGKVTSVPVEVGDSNDTQTEIISGINEGDSVVIGQTGTTTGSTGAATSPFGNTRGGFGAAASGGGGTQMFIQRR